MRATRWALGLVLLASLAVPGVLITDAGAGERASLPPSSRTALTKIFADRLEPFGLRVTRAALVNSRQKRDPKGSHLAVYVEPTGEYSVDQYVDGTVDVTKVFLPYVFDRWKGLKSFDVCQEPRPTVDPRPVPPPETQVYATRAGNDLVDWKTVDVATMIRTSDEEAAATPKNGEVRFMVFVAKHLQVTPAYQQAVGTDTSSTPTSPIERDYG
jgi:hypothetical protein